jgi:hypothetical protein
LLINEGIVSGTGINSEIGRGSWSLLRFIISRRVSARKNGNVSFWDSGSSRASKDELRRVPSIILLVPLRG